MSSKMTGFCRWPFIKPEQAPEPDAIRLWNQIGKHFFENLDRFDWRGHPYWKSAQAVDGRRLNWRGAIATGLDILSYKYLSMEAADVWFAAEPILYFERVVGDMHQLPFQPDVFDFVLATSSLHRTNRLVTAL